MKQARAIIALLKKKEILLQFAPIFLVVLAGLFPISWFRNGLPLSFYDEDIPLPPFYDIESYKSAWYSRSAPGFFSGRILAKLLFVDYFIFLNKLGIPLQIAEALYISGFTLLAGLSMYFLFRLLFSTHFSRVGAMFAALLYINNPILYHIIWHYMMISIYPAYAVTPLLIILFIKGLQSKKILQYSAVTTAVLLLVSPLGAGIPYSVPLVIIFISSIIFYVATSVNWKGLLLNSFKYLTVTSILTILIQSWWIIPLGLSINNAFSITENFRSIIGSSSFDTLLITSKTTSFVNLFQMQGFYPAYVNDIGGVPWSSYHPTYFEPLFIILGFIVPVLSILGLFYTKAGNWRYYFGFLWIFALLVMGGAHAPFGGIYIWLWNKIPYMAAFRGFYTKFGLLLPFASSVLAGLGIVSVLNISSILIKSLNLRISRNLSAIPIIFLLIFLLDIWTFPYWNGEIIARANSSKAGAFIKVPDYYSTADDWLKKQGSDFRILTLPLSKLHYAAYTWDHGYWGMEPSQWLFSTPTIGRITTSQSYSLALSAAELINKGEPSNVACLLGLLNVRYLMLHGDTNWDYVRNSEWWVSNRDISESQIKDFLAQQPNIRPVTTIGKLFLYENTKALPHTYVARRLIFLNGGQDDLVSRYNNCNIDSPPAIFLSKLDSSFTSWFPDDKEIEMNLNDSPTVSTKKINANQYEIHVENAKSPFVLVFNESYDRDWSAHVLGQNISNHFLVNGYANAWYIEQTGSYDISISYTKQRLVETGFLLSYLGGLLSIVVFIVGFKRRLL